MQANFNNFVPFGGWSKPSIHQVQDENFQIWHTTICKEKRSYNDLITNKRHFQYSGDVKGACSVGNVDMNWYP